MAMGAGALYSVAFGAVSAKETSGHGENSLGSGEQQPGAEGRWRRHALQRRKHGIFTAVEWQGNITKRGRPTRRGRGSIYAFDCRTARSRLIKVAWSEIGVKSKRRVISFELLVGRSLIHFYAGEVT